MPKLLLLDKDNTLIQPKSGKQFVDAPTDQVLMPGVKETLDRYADWTKVIVTNQGGVSCRHKTLESAIEETRYAMELSSASMGILCPDMGLGATAYQIQNETTRLVNIEDFAVSNYEGFHTYGFRKPFSGMLHLAIESFAGRDSWEKILMIGDRNEDCEAAFMAKVHFMWAHEWNMEKNA